MRLSDRLHQPHFVSPAQEAMLNVLVTASWLEGEVSRLLASSNVTQSQFNVLRILRGSHPSPLTCSDIGSRLVERTPDVTRLLDRLEKAGLLTRCRSENDRRVVQVCISEKGLALLKQLDPAIGALHEKLAGLMTEEEFQTLNVLLEKLRADELADGENCGC